MGRSVPVIVDDEGVNTTAASLPFDQVRLDRCLERAGVDLILATSKHNVQYLLGGYHCLFFGQMDAIGLSRYLPVLGYPRGAPAQAFYIGNVFDASQQELSPIWVPQIRNVTWTSEQAAVQAAHVIQDLRRAEATIGVEMPFLPADAYQTLQRLLPRAHFVDVVAMLEDLRAVKRPGELRLLQEASDGIIEAMRAVFRRTRAGMTTRQIADMLLQEEVAHGLAFDYCLTAMGGNPNRTPSATPWERGMSLSMDSGGNRAGYIGDLARMAVMGPPTRAQEDYLREVDAIQMAARAPVKAGAHGRDIYEHAYAALAQCPHRADIEFLAHGMGLVSHEAPRLTSTGPVPYPADHEGSLLEAGMVISIETTLATPRTGYIKLEDTISVTEQGGEAYGDGARGWNIVEQ